MNSALQAFCEANLSRESLENLNAMVCRIELEILATANQSARPPMAEVFHKPLIDIHEFIKEKEFFNNENMVNLYLMNAMNLHSQRNDLRGEKDFYFPV